MVYWVSVVLMNENRKFDIWILLLVLIIVFPRMSEFGMDLSKLPPDVREKLAELDLELSEGEISGLLYRIHIVCASMLKIILCSCTSYLYLAS